MSDDKQVEIEALRGTLLELGTSERLAARAVSWARPVYATEPAEAWEAGDLVDVEFYNHPEKPEGEGWRPLVFADTGDTVSAAAPDLLAALENVMANPTTFSFEPIRAAIAKAKGEDK